MADTGMKGAAPIVLAGRNWWWGARPVFGAFLAIILLLHFTNRSTSDAIVDQWFGYLCTLAALLLLWRRKVCYYPVTGRLTVEYGFPFASFRRRYEISAFNRVALMKFACVLPPTESYVPPLRIVLEGTSRVTLRRISEPQTAEYFACATATLTGLPLYRSASWGELLPGTTAGRNATLRRGLEGGEARGLYRSGALIGLFIGYAIPAAGVLVAGWPVKELFVLLWMELWMLGLLCVALITFADERVPSASLLEGFFWLLIGLAVVAGSAMMTAPFMLFPIFENLNFSAFKDVMGGKGLWLPMAALFASHVSRYLPPRRAGTQNHLFWTARTVSRRFIIFFLVSLLAGVLYRYFFGVDATGALIIVLLARFLVELYLYRLEHWQQLEAHEVLALTETASQ